MDTIRDGLRSVNPIAIGMTPKRFANIRSDFVAAVKRESPRLARLPERRAKSWRHSGLKAALLSIFIGASPLAFDDFVVDAFRLDAFCAGVVA
jgi:hypothetical protein